MDYYDYAETTGSDYYDALDQVEVDYLNHLVDVKNGDAEYVPLGDWLDDWNG